MYDFLWQRYILRKISVDNLARCAKKWLTSDEANRLITAVKESEGANE